jgi:hypothetical protein
MLDGDDYWTSPHKLQKQVNFLDSHPECALCFHDALIVHETGSEEPRPFRPSQKAFSTIEDLFLDNYIPTSAVMYRRGLFEKVPDWFGELNMGDWPAYILMARHGRIGFINETMSTYVIHHCGAWSSRDWRNREKAIIELFEIVCRYLEPEHARTINRILRFRSFRLSAEYEKSGDTAGARVYALKSLRKHLSILREFSERWGAVRDQAGTVPDYMKKMRTTVLIRSALRLSAVPALRAHIPVLDLFLRAIARRLNWGL